MKDYTTDTSEHNYTLKAIIRHRGNTPRSGHYLADCNIMGKWYHFDDLQPADDFPKGRPGVEWTKDPTQDPSVKQQAYKLY